MKIELTKDELGIINNALNEVCNGVDNVRSVDGILLHNGEYVVRDAEQFGGQVLGDGGGAVDCW